MRAQLLAHSLSVSIAGTDVFTDISIELAPGDRVGLIGPNGAGKTTLLRALAGLVPIDRGRAELIPPDAEVTLLDQERAARDGESVIDFLARRVGVAAADEELTEATDGLVDPTPDAADRYDRALQRWLRLGAADFPARAAAILDGLGFDSSWLERLMVECSGGERARVGLAAVELVAADVVLLDEPTNDLDTAGIERLEALVVADDRPRLIVSHDRRFLDSVVTAVADLDPFERRLDRFEGGWSDYLREREAAAAHARRRFDDYRSERGRLEQRARTERSWATKGAATARRSDEPDKNVRRFNIETSENLAARARRTERAIERLDVVDKPWEPWQLQFTIGEVERSGDLVASLDDAVIVNGEGVDAFELGPIDVLVSAGERIRITGANGSGKTTLIDALLGRHPLRSGTHRLGSSVVVGELDQQRFRLDTDATVLDALMDETDMIISDARRLLATFGLGADHVERPLSTLSPGERTRLLLAVFQGSGVNTLVLDEPTNHLDLPAVEQLESALERFAGTLLVITHDRAFADAVAIDRTIELDS